MENIEMTKRGWCFWGIMFLLGSCHSPANRGITLFAGVGMKDVVEEIAGKYEQEKGEVVRISLASSAILARQLTSGASADVVILASEKWAEYCEVCRVVNTDSRTVVAGNRLVLIAPKNSKMAPFKMAAHSNLPEMIIGKLAIGDPHSVPAGMYGMDSFKYFAWDKQLKSKFIFARDVRAVLAFVAMGEVQAGVVYASDAAKSDKVKVLAVFPEESHKCIQFISYKTVKCNALSDQFYKFLTSRESIGIWQKHGFTCVNSF